MSDGKEKLQLCASSAAGCAPACINTGLRPHWLVARSTAGNCSCGRALAALINRLNGF